MVEPIQSSSSEGLSNTELAVKRTDQAGLRTRWAADRTLWAADRTFIAWLRTSISMIGFGIGIGKAGDLIGDSVYFEGSGQGLMAVGSAFIALAVLGLLGALIQDYRISKRLSDAGYGRVEPVPLGLTMGVLVTLVGFLGIYVIFF